VGAGGSSGVGGRAGTSGRGGGGTSGDWGSAGAGTPGVSGSSGDVRSGGAWAGGGAGAGAFAGSPRASAGGSGAPLWAGGEGSARFASPADAGTLRIGLGGAPSARPLPATAWPCRRVAPELAVRAERDSLLGDSLGAAAAAAVAGA